MSWEIEVAEYMARTGSTIAEAATAAGVQVASTQLDAVERRKSFQELLREARNRYFIQLATSPTWKKDTAIGILIADGQKLREAGAFDKASECVFKAAKMAAWVGPESTVSVFGELSQRDLDAIRESVTKDVQSGAKVN